jgi:hypothetical protein
MGNQILPVHGQYACLRHCYVCVVSLQINESLDERGLDILLEFELQTRYSDTAESTRTMWRPSRAELMLR